jgi:phosphoribosylformylglycinamidine synthase
MPSPATLPFSTASDAEIKTLLGTYKIGLTVEEARTVSTLLGRDPTVVEAVIWGIQGSEHCSYKSSRPFLRQFVTDGDHIILGPKEDSGIVAITDSPDGKRWGFVVTHESHNHPSQIVPYEGAATGIGGTVRDVVCMGARVIGCLDMLRLGDLQTEESKTIAHEVVRGIGGYGNPLGVPNLGGDMQFDAGYNSNCLVNAIAVGIVREDEVIHSYVPQEAADVGYDIILIGKPTDRSGFGGAAFASASMEEDKREQNSGAVQEPNPFLERHILASTYALFDWLVASKNLHRVSFKDLGAGGVVCASVEQVADVGFGAEINLDNVHTALPDLPSEVIACAETQERLCWICHPDLTEHILQHYNVTWDLPSVAENARASVIGKVTHGGVYRVRHKGELVCEAKAHDITCGLQYNRPTTPIAYTGDEPNIRCEHDAISVNGKTFSVADVFRAMITHRNGCSRSPAFLHFDKTVIGNGVVEAGEADASVIAPLQDLQSYVLEGTHPGWDALPKEHQWTGVAIAADGNGRYGRISPYWQGANAAVESMRNVASVGASPRALTDCLNYGNPEIPEQLWQLAEGTRGIADASAHITVEGQPVPIISGNVSLYNSRPDGSAIDPTAIVSCTGVMPDARKAVTMQIKHADSTIYLVGDRKDECGGSLYYDVLEGLTKSTRNALLGKYVPEPDFAEVSKQIHLVTSTIRSGAVTAAHDISDGGLLMALFEMLLPQRKIGGTLGLSIDLDALSSSLRTDVLLFSETGGFLLEVPAAKEKEFLDTVASEDMQAVAIGHTSADGMLHVQRGDTALLTSAIAPLVEQWSHALDSQW